MMKNKIMLAVLAMFSLMALGGCATQTAIDNYGKTMKAVSPNGDKVVYGYALQKREFHKALEIDPASRNVKNPEPWEILLRNGLNQSPTKVGVIVSAGTVSPSDIVAVRLPNRNSTAAFISVVAKPGDSTCFWDGSVVAYSLDAGVVCPKYNWNYKTDLGFLSNGMEGLRLVDPERNILPFSEQK